MSKRLKTALFTLLPLMLTLSAAMVVAASSGKDALMLWYEARMQESANHIQISLKKTVDPQIADDLIPFIEAKTKIAKGVITGAGTNTANTVTQNIQLHNAQHITELEQKKIEIAGGLGTQTFKRYIELKKQELDSSIDQELQSFFQGKLEELGTPAE